MEQRYEIKSVPLLAEISSIQSRLEAQGFHQAYPQRFVSSIYWDSPTYNLARLHIAGIYDRSKVRQRWYPNQLHAKPNTKVTVERKRKIGQASIKTSNYDQNITDGIGGNAGYIPVVAIDFCRDYFVNPEDTVRVTIDRHIAAAHLPHPSIASTMETWDALHFVPVFDCVIEAKFDCTTHFDLSQITHCRVGACSKYLRALSAIGIAIG